MDLTTAATSVHSLAQAFAERLPYIALGIVVFLLFYGAGRLVGAGARRFTNRTQRHYHLGLVLGRLATGALALLGLLVAMVIAVPGFTPGQLVNVLGIGSVAIGFAFRDILQNFLAGILLLLSQPFRIGDQIKSGEFEGTVKEIQTRATFITTYDGRSIVIPNSTLFVNPVTVNTAYTRRRLEHDFVVGLDRDLEDAKRALVDATVGLTHVLDDPAPEALVVEVGKDAAKIRLRWWIEPPDQYEMLTGLDDVLVRGKRALFGTKAPAPDDTAPPGPTTPTASPPSQPTHAESPERAPAAAVGQQGTRSDGTRHETNVLARLLRLRRP